MIETAENRLKRLKMRSWRRGTKEMDLILGPFADTGLAALDAPQIDLYAVMLDENDHDLYAWFSGRDPAPERYRKIIDTILHDRRFR